MHVAGEYYVEEYEEKLIRAKKYLKKTQLFNELKMNEGVRGDDEVMKNYLTFTIFLKLFGTYCKAI